MKRLSSIKRYVFWLFLATMTGVVVGYLAFVVINLGVSVSWLNSTIISSRDQNINSKKIDLNVLTPNSISYSKFSPLKTGQLIYIDSTERTLTMYNKGKMEEVFKILLLGGKGSSRELVAGDYHVARKDKYYESSVYHVSLPYVIAFSGNYFIHGVLQNKDGSYRDANAASVGISLKDAEKLFNLVSVGMKVKISAPISFIQLSSRDKYFLGLSEPVISIASIAGKISLKASSYLIKDMDSGHDLIQKNESSVFPIASVTKLVTAMVVLDNIGPNAIIEISKKAYKTSGHQGNLLPGEKFKASDLINCLLLESSNDAAEAFAEEYGRDKFIALMNAKAKSIGMLNTSFNDPSGLSKNNVSSTEDLSILISYVEKNRTDVLLITKKKTYEVKKGVMSGAHLWININHLIRSNNQYYSGGKDGFTSDALQTFVGVFSIPLSEFDYKRLSIAVLKSSDRDGDINKILLRIMKSIYYDDGTTLESISKLRQNGIAEIQSEKNVSMMFVGDIMLDRGVKKFINKYGNGDYGFPFELVPFLKDPDITFGNLEGPVSDVGYDLGNKYSFRMNPLAMEALKAAGFDALSVANNHIGDYGFTAFEDTLSRLSKAGIVSVGGGINGRDARSVKIIERNGVRIGFLGFSDVGPKWLSGKDNLPSILSASDPNLEKIISDAARQVDHLVVSFHFGVEYHKDVSDRQTFLAHRAIDAGARVVIGTHPHVGEEVEKYKNGIVAYSLGNFVFDQPFSEDTMLGNILEVIVDKNSILEVNESQVKSNKYFQPSLLQ